MTVKETVSALDQFFFKPQPVNSVALLRIFLGIILLIHWLTIWSHLQVFWGTDALVSLQTAMDRSNGRIMLFEYFTDQPLTAQFFAILHLIGVLGMTFGLFTRFSIALAFFTLVSFHTRNTFILNSADVIMRNLLFFLFFTHAGELYSFDAWIRRERGWKPWPRERAPWALRLIQIQFCVIYVATVMFKMKGEFWAEGTAVYYATRLDEFVRVPVSLLNSMIVIKFLTWSTLVVEGALGTLVWFKDLRYWILLAGVGLHLGIELTMNIPLFEWVMIAMMMCMVDSRDIIRLGEWLSEKKRTLSSMSLQETELAKTR